MDAAITITKEEVQQLLAPRDKVLARILRASRPVAEESTERRSEFESELLVRYPRVISESGQEGDIVSEYSLMVAVFLLLSTAGWMIAIVDAVGILESEREEAMARALYAATMPMSITICPMLYYGTLGTGVILSDARLNIVCYIAFIVDGFCYGEEYFDIHWLYPYIFNEVEDGSSGGSEFGITPSLVLGALFAVTCTVVFGWLGVNVLALGRRNVVDRNLSLLQFSDNFCATSVKIVGFQALLGVMQVVNVANAQNGEQLARVVRINEASYSFSLVLAAGYVTKILIFDVPGLTTHGFFNGEGTGWSVAAVFLASAGALAGTGGWLLAYQTSSNSTSTSFDVSSVLGNISTFALAAANTASALNLLQGISGGCSKFVRSGAEAAMQMRDGNHDQSDAAALPRGTSPSHAMSDVVLVDASDT
eukprot:SAG31_NODE_1452_length_8286_cov_6.329547_8_plen_423_part_00